MSDVLIVFVLLATVVLRVGVVLGVLYLLLPRGPVCRKCQVEMTKIRSLVLERVVRVVERRWCMECGWHGIVRRGPAQSVSLRDEQPTPPTAG